MRTFDLCGLGNALVDILLELDEAAFAALGFDRGTMRLVEHAEQDTLLERFCERAVLRQGNVVPSRYRPRRFR